MKLRVVTKNYLGSGKELVEKFEVTHTIQVHRVGDTNPDDKPFLVGNYDCLADFVQELSQRRTNPTITLEV